MKTLCVAAVLMLAASAQADEALARKLACTACHAIDKKLLGPSFKQVAAKHMGQADAQAVLEDKIRKGGVGVWGAIAMPAQPNLKDTDVKALATWILAQ